MTKNHRTPIPGDTPKNPTLCTLEGCTRPRVTARHCQHHARQLWRNTHLIQRADPAPVVPIGDLLGGVLGEIEARNRRVA